MSQATATRLTSLPGRAPAARRAAPAPKLRLVSPEQGWSRRRVVLTSGSLVITGLLCLLMIQVSLTQGTYELRNGQAELDRLNHTRQALSEDLIKKDSSPELAAAAAKLGMVPAPNTAFIDVTDGKIVGVARTAAATANR